MRNITLIFNSHSACLLHCLFFVEADELVLATSSEARSTDMEKNIAVFKWWFYFDASLIRNLNNMYN